MTSGIQDIPEIRGLGRRQNLIRIPQECDVPITRRVRQLIDTAEFRRLARISQLGLVSLVYPAAHHSRFEHSLGVYRLAALLYLQQLSHDERFCETVQKKDAERFLAAALLHDLGHWPFCHPIEDINLPGVPQHELFANSFLLESEIAQTLRDAWGIAPQDRFAAVRKASGHEIATVVEHVVGPIDVDKMDYLMRDSLHAGVPYGRNFDQQRLIGSLCVNESGDGLAITEKGRTAAEMMVFARYVMFSEVYWHHAVRCATAMLQRAFYLLHVNLDLDTLFRQSEHELIASVRKAAEKNPAADLLDGLFGPERRLYKRFAQYSGFFNCPTNTIACPGGPYAFLVTCAEQLAAVLQRELGIEVRPHEVLFDAPPVKLEVQFNVEIHFPKEGCYRQLGDVSPVVRTLAREQFDDYVKRVRVFIHPRLLRNVDSLEDRDTLVREAVSLAGG